MNINCKLWYIFYLQEHINLAPSQLRTSPVHWQSADLATRAEVKQRLQVSAKPIEPEMKVIRRFAKSRGLLRDCEIFANLRLIFV